MHKKNFLEILTTYTHEELSDLISKKGKDPKQINVICFIDNDEDNADKTILKK